MSRLGLICVTSQPAAPRGLGCWYQGSLSPLSLKSGHRTEPVPHPSRVCAGQLGGTRAAPVPEGTSMGVGRGQSGIGRAGSALVSQGQGLMAQEVDVESCAMDSLGKDPRESKQGQ